jgi:hypothetical protein
MQQKLGAALSIAVEALCNMRSVRYGDVTDRDKLFSSTLAAIREHVGEDTRLTTMKVSCAWCGDDKGEKEGNGSTGESSTICPKCLYHQGARGI